MSNKLEKAKKYILENTWLDKEFVDEALEDLESEKDLECDPCCVCTANVRAVLKAFIDGMKENE